MMKPAAVVLRMWLGIYFFLRVGTPKSSHNKNSGVGEIEALKMGLCL